MKRYYYGGKRRRAYFEGWYFKCRGKDDAIALIPALHIAPDGQRSASLQVITDRQAWWLDYPEGAFRAAENELRICMGKNRFCREGIRLDVEQDGLSLRGGLRLGAFTELKSDIMGPFQFLPRMECAHGILSMGHSIDGALELNGTPMDFSGGTGYIETDRGRSFPKAYLWAQCTWGGEAIHSVMLAIAAIPVGGAHFTGCICAVVWQGKEYRLATYRGAKILRWSEQGGEVRQGTYRICVEVLERHAVPLRAPAAGCMGRTIHESLCATVRVRFWVGSDLLFDHRDTCAGFEYSNTSPT